MLPAGILPTLGAKTRQLVASWRGTTRLWSVPYDGLGGFGFDSEAAVPRPSGYRHVETERGYALPSHAERG